MYNPTQTPAQMRANLLSDRPIPTYEKPQAVFHRRAATAIAEDSKIHCDATQAAGNALESLNQDFERVLFLRSNRSTMDTQHSHLQKVKNNFDKMLSQHARQVDAAKFKIDRELATIEETKKKSLGPASKHSQEIRSVLRNMTEEKRSEFVQAAMDAKDTETLAAIIDAPPVLSGFDEKALSWIKRRSLEALIPAETFTREKSLLKARDAIFEAVNVLLTDEDVIVGGDTFKEYQNAEKLIRERERELFEDRSYFSTASTVAEDLRRTPADQRFSINDATARRTAAERYQARH